MTMEELSQNIEYAISQYEQAKEQEESLYEMMQDAERDMSRYSAQASASSDDDPSSQRYALEQMRAAAIRYQQCQNQLQQVQNAKAKALQYLQSTRSELVNVITSIEEKLPKFDQSISTFAQMANNPFGASAGAQLPQLRAKREEYQRNLDYAYSLLDRIDSALNDGGDTKRLVLRR